MSWQCSICGKSFKLKNTLKRHVDSVHEGKKFKCDICGKDFNRKGSIAKHKLNAHKIDIRKKPS